MRWWIKIDKHLSDKKEFLSLLKGNRESPDEVLGLLVRFWSWADDQMVDGFIEGVDIPALVKKFGPKSGAQFWQKLTEVGWIFVKKKGIVIPNHQKMFGDQDHERQLSAERSRNYRKRASRARHAPVTHDARDLDGELDGELDVNGFIDLRASTSNGESTLARASSVDADALKPIAGDGGLVIDWLKARYDAMRIRQKLAVGSDASGQDNSLILKAATLGQTITHDFLWDAVEAVIVAYARDKPPKQRRCAYFHGVLRSKCAELGIDLNAMLAKIKIQPTE